MTSPLRIVSVVAGLIGVMLATSVHAQAWLPERGSLDVSVAYANTLSKKHYTPDGNTEDVGHTRTQVARYLATYAPTSRVLLTGQIPWVSARYRGDFQHPTRVDDGDYHGTFTDFTVTVHYQALLEPLAIAPYAGLVIPSHDYEVLGHAAPGRGLNEGWLGFYAGRSLDTWIPRTYLQIRYNYAFVETVAGISHDRSNVEAEVGHFLNPRTSLRIISAWQATHGGIDVPVPRDHHLFDHHDQLADESYLNLGGGVGHVLNPRLGIYGLYLTSLWGRNAHKVDNALILGFNYRAASR